MILMQQFLLFLILPVGKGPSPIRYIFSFSSSKSALVGRLFNLLIYGLLTLGAGTICLLLLSSYKISSSSSIFPLGYSSTLTSLLLILTSLSHSDLPQVQHQVAASQIVIPPPK